MNDTIIQAARGWIGTPFHHHGRVKNVGVDCLGLLIGVARELDLRDNQGILLAGYDALDYGHLPDEQRLYTALKQHCKGARKLREGLIALFEIDGSARHLGIIGEFNGDLTLIHAYAPARKVVEHRLDEHWRRKIVKLFRLPLFCAASK